ncbi:AAA family ATPase [Clostridium perfringens]|uniref:AAA family ATPase n=1 Tax=Clostridium perfringens TaxID=1502 RepID=UPI0039E7F4A8
MNKEIFKIWMKDKERLSDKTIDNYFYELGKISELINSEGIFDKDIYDVDNCLDFNILFEKINKNKKYIERNFNNHRQSSSALRQYKKFLEREMIYNNISLNDPNLLKYEFKKWLKSKKKSNGDLYSNSTIEGYSVALEKACFELINLDMEYKNLFYISDLSELKKNEGKIRSSKNFASVNERYGNGRLSAAISKYKEFLSKIDLNNYIENETVEQVGATLNDENFKNLKEIYTEVDFLSEVFISDKEYETMKGLLKRKKNLILQGDPGVGKTFVAKRLAYSIMGEKDESRVKMVQFHQSYSYEDFVMGYRPSENGFELKEGPFYEFCIKAANEPEKDFYFIIDEINRGNMSKIFGELLMLIESDKRGKSLTLTYSNEEFYVPNNLYIIGMMNTADRSLAIIDYALRRRFCFVELNPAFGTDLFKEKLISQGASNELVSKIISRVGSLNKEIENDRTLGKGFRIGHSYFCNYEEDDSWYEEIIKYEIDPLLREYWFDEEEKAESYIDYLLRG